MAKAHLRSGLTGRQKLPAGIGRYKITGRHVVPLTGESGTFIELGRVAIKPGFLEQRPLDGPDEVGRLPPAGEWAAERQSRTSGKTINREGSPPGWRPGTIDQKGGQKPGRGVHETKHQAGALLPKAQP